MIGIYKITAPTGKIYIGQSRSFNKRLNIYKNYRCKTQPRIYSSLKKYGFDKHIFEIIEKCDIEFLNERERFWQDYYKSSGKNGLNCMLTKASDKIGFVSEETKAKISKTKTGSKHTKETIDKMIKQRMGNTYNKGNRSLILLDFNTGVFYSSIRDYCNIHSLSHSSIYCVLVGSRKNEKFNNLKII